MIITNYNTKRVRDISIHAGDILFFLQTQHSAIIVLGVGWKGSNLMIDFLDFESNQVDYYVINKDEYLYELRAVIRSEN